jgi:Sec-independent protein translocase protein TatA
MFGFSPADWIFIAGVMVVIFFFVALSDMHKR